MKKLLPLCLLLLLLTACTQQEVAPDRIAHAALTQEQQQVIDLLQSTEQKIHFFEFTTEADFTGMEFWAEVYRYGALEERLHGIHISDDSPLMHEGRLALTLALGEELAWSFALSGAQPSADSSVIYRNTASYSRGESLLAHGCGPISETAAIRPGEELVLYTCVFTDGPIASGFLGQPELLAEYPLATLVKCRFDA